MSYSIGFLAFFCGTFAYSSASRSLLRDKSRNIQSSNCEFPQDGFNYSECKVPDICLLADDFCDTDEIAGYNTTECNLDGGDCKPCEYPDDGFDYSLCLENKCWIGDGSCRSWFNTIECNYDGGDCEPCTFPDDGFDYSSCPESFACFVGDGWCDSSANIDSCNKDGGDCEDIVGFGFPGIIIALFYMCFGPLIDFAFTYFSAVIFILVNLPILIWNALISFS